MFNAMSPAQLTTVLSTILRESADWSRPLDGFQRGQLKSAGSIGRHLAAELAGGPAVAADFRARLRSVLDEAGGAAPEAPVRALADALDQQPTGDLAPLGGPVADLLAACRQRTDPAAAALAARLRSALRELVDAEIDVLSTPHPTGGTS